MMATELHRETRGADNDGPVVLWVHGVDSDLHVWDAAVDIVAESSPCVAIDLPGHGASADPDDAEAYSRSAVLADLDAVIVAIRGGDADRPVVLVGHSLGGYMGLAHALTRADGATHVDGLVLVSTGPGFRDTNAMADWNTRVEANASKYSVSELAATIAFHSDSMVMDNLEALAGARQVPIALVIGDGDRAFLGANDYLERKLPHASRTTVEGGRHFVMKSHPQAVADAVAIVVGEASHS